MILTKKQISCTYKSSYRKLSILHLLIILPTSKISKFISIILNYSQGFLQFSIVNKFSHESFYFILHITCNSTYFQLNNNFGYE